MKVKQLIKVLRTLHQDQIITIASDEEWNSVHHIADIELSESTGNYIISPGMEDSGDSLNELIKELE